MKTKIGLLCVIIGLVIGFSVPKQQAAEIGKVTKRKPMAFTVGTPLKKVKLEQSLSRVGFIENNFVRDEIIKPSKDVLIEKGKKDTKEVQK